MTLRKKIQESTDYVKNQLGDFNNSILDVEIESKPNAEFCKDINELKTTQDIKFILATLLVK